MVRTTVILLGLTFGLLIASARATTYYLDSTSGSDWHAGTEATRALRTLRSASANLYHRGDQILLKAGSVWTSMAALVPSGLSFISRKRCIPDDSPISSH